MASVKTAYVKGKIDKSVLAEFSFILYRMFYLELWRVAGLRKTPTSIIQMGNLLLSLSRVIEEIIRSGYGLAMDIKVFNYCHDKWFSKENWNSVSAYENNVVSLIDDFIKNTWALSLDGRNLVFTFKIRNAVAHRLQTEPMLSEKFGELSMAMMSSLAFVCDSFP